MKPILANSLLFLPMVLRAQNLVPNGSFEEYTACPPYFGYSFLAAGWGGPGGIGYQSPDYFNACNTTNVVGVPSSQFGYQLAADGQAYMGMAISADGVGPGYREIIGAQLTEPLQIGVPVCLSFKMAVGGFGSSAANSAQYTCKNFGIKLFVDPPTDWESYLFPNSATLSMDAVPTDTAIWYSVSDVYTPDSAYAYIALGNFFADSLSEVTLLDSTGFGAAPAYAFVDDVRLSYMLDYCTLELGTSELPDIELRTYPNPTAAELQISGGLLNRQYLRYAVVNANGRVVQQGTALTTDGSLSIDTHALASGPYVLDLMINPDRRTRLPFIHVSP